MTKSATPPVTEYIKNVGKSFKYAMFNYVDNNAPALTEFADTNAELFKDITKAVANPREALKSAHHAVFASPIGHAASTAFENAISDIKSGKFYNKERLNRAEMEAFGFEDGEDDMSLDSMDGESSGITSGEQAIIKASNQGAAMVSSNVSGAVAASARYTVSQMKASTAALFQQAAIMNGTMAHGFKSLATGIDALNQFNTQVVQTLAQNATTYFQKTTDIMVENNAILKEMLEMQRNLYRKPAQQEMDPLNLITGAYGTPNIKQYGKQVLKNLKATLSEQTGGLTDVIDEDMLKMLAANPLAAIPGLIVSTAMGPMMKTALQNMNKTVQGLFGTFVSKMIYNANDPTKGPFAQLMGKIFGVRSLTKDGMDTSSYNKDGPTPFDWDTKRSIIEVIPAHLSRIEAALTGGSPQVYNHKTGKWTSMRKLKEDFKSEKSFYVEKGAAAQDAAMRELMDAAKLSKHSKANVKKAMKSINAKRYADGGWLDLSGDINTKAERYGVDANTMRLYEALYKQIDKTIKMNTSADILSSKLEYTKLLKQREADNEVYKHLFTGMDKANSLDSQGRDISGTSKGIAAAFDLNKQKDSFNKNIFDYLRAIAINTSGCMGTGKGGGGNPPFLIPPTPTEKKMRAAAQARRDIAFTQPGMMYEGEMAHSLGNIAVAGKATRIANRAMQIEENSTGISNFINTRVRGLRDFANEKKFDAENGEVVKGLDKILHAASIGEKFAAISNSIDKIVSKPTSMLSGVIEAADDHIYNAFFEDDQNPGAKVSDLLLGKDGKRAKGFFGKLQVGLSNILDAAKRNMDQSNAEGRLSMFQMADGMMKDLVGFNMSEVKDATLKQGKALLKGSWNTVSKDAVAGYGKLNDFFSSQDKYYRGARNVTKSGLAFISKGERIIPSDENIYNPDLANADKRKDARNEAKMKADFISMIKKADSRAYGGTFGTNNSYVDEVTSRVGQPMNDIAYALFGNNTDDIKKNIAQIGAEVKQAAPNVMAGGILGLAGGALLGGPLLGAVAGSAISIASNSETIQKGLFGEKIFDENGKDTGKRKGGLISAEMQETMSKYMPDMKAYGIAGGALGLLTGFGPLGGAMIGSAISIAKNNESIRNALFGENGLINDDMKKMLKKHFPGMAKGAGVGALVGALFGGAIIPGALPMAIAGSAIGLATTTDEFKDFLLGKEDEKGNRYGGVAQIVRDSVVTPLSDLAHSIKSNFSEWFLKDMAKPIGDAMAPIGKSIELGIRGAINTIGGTVAGLFDSKDGIPLLSGLRYGLFGKSMASGGGLIGGAVKKTGWLLSRPSAAIGSIGDRLRKGHIQSGNADYMTAAERRNFMAGKGKSNYNHRELDDMLAGATVEELEAMKAEFGALKEGKGYFDKEVNSIKGNLGSKVIELVKDTGRAEKIMSAIQSGDIKEAQNYVNSANISSADKMKLTKLISEEGGKLRNVLTKQKNYTGKRADMIKALRKKGFTKLDEKNIDTYSKLFSAELKGRKKAMGVDKTPEDQATEAITSTLDSNFSLLLPLVQRTNELLASMQADGGITSSQRKKLVKQDKKAVKYGDKSMKNLYASRAKRASKLENKFNSIAISEANKDLILDDDLYGKLSSIKSGGFFNNYNIKDLNKIIEMDEDTRNRFLILANAGYQVRDMGLIKRMTDREFHRLQILIEAGIKISDMKAVMKMDTETAENMAKMYRGGMRNLKQKQLQDLAESACGVFIGNRKDRKRLVSACK